MLITDKTEIEHRLSVLKVLYEELGYEWFDGNKAFNLNIIGVRYPYVEAGNFDDEMWLVYRDTSLEWKFHVYPFTTEPGKYYLKNPMKKHGAAILVPDQYKGVYKIDMHLGKYEAVCQRLGKVAVYRDGNRDTILDMNPNSAEEGFFWDQHPPFVFTWTF